MSARLLADLRSVLKRPKFHRVVTTSAIEELISVMERQAFVMSPRHHVHVTRDPDDDHLLDLALAGAVAAVISGDKDLTCLKSFAGIPVLSPRSFLTWFAKRRR